MADDKGHLMKKGAVTLKEAAELLGCHTATLRRAIQDKTLKAAKLGSDYRISMLELCEFFRLQGGGKLIGTTELHEQEGIFIKLNLNWIDSDAIGHSDFVETKLEGVLVSRETGRVAFMVNEGRQMLVVSLKK